MNGARQVACGRQDTVWSAAAVVVVVLCMAPKDVEAAQAAADGSKSVPTQPPAAAVGVSLSPKPSLLSQLLFFFVSPIVRCASAPRMHDGVAARQHCTCMSPSV